MLFAVRIDFIAHTLRRRKRIELTTILNHAVNGIMILSHKMVVAKMKPMPVNRPIKC